MDKEVDDALHMLLHCAMKDDTYTTQGKQYEIVVNELQKLEKIKEKLKQDIKVFELDFKKPVFMTQSSQITAGLISYSRDLLNILEE